MGAVSDDQLDPARHGIPSDEELQAWLDGPESDPDLQASGESATPRGTVLLSPSRPPVQTQKASLPTRSVDRSWTGYQVALLVGFVLVIVVWIVLVPANGPLDPATPH
jgi:hypothetical protein